MKRKFKRETFAACRVPNAEQQLLDELGKGGATVQTLWWEFFWDEAYINFVLKRLLRKGLIKRQDYYTKVYGLSDLRPEE
jgi:hypothetical protein